ncbi:MAG: hypothetical protein P8I86_01940 [Luminiphilus sp.]|nr:hypothetical protein [Luminiphilus sp.]
MRFQHLNVSLLLAAALFHPAGKTQQSVQAPYDGTVYVDSGWITPADTSTFIDKVSLGIERVTLYDRRIANFTDVDAHSYRLEFWSGVVVVARVNTEFDEPTASQLADKWGFVLGQTPLGLIDYLGELHIQPGNELMGGNGFTNPTHVLIHEDHGAANLANGWAEEEVLHELGHAVFQPRVEDADWVAAQDADPCFISDYAAENPIREDVAETLGPYLAMKFLTDRVTNVDQDKISNCIAARSSVLDAWFTEMNMSYSPFSSAAAEEAILRIALEEPVAGQVHTGVGNLRGWAVATEGVTRVEIMINGVSAFEAPYGGARGDVGGAFPDIPDSNRSGFSLAFNYSELPAGPNNIAAVAYDGLNAVAESTANFEVVRFPDFIRGEGAVNLGEGTCSVTSDEISIVDAVINGTFYNLVLKWRPAEQGFEVVEIQ